MPVNGRALRRYVEDLLRSRRPRSFRADEADVAELRTAIILRAARGDDAPRKEFVAALHRRLAAQQAADPGPAGAIVRPLRRRGLIAGGVGIAAAGAALGALVDRAVLNSHGSAGSGSGTPGETLEPARGEWRTVAASDQLPEGAVRAFDLGAIVGFVRRVDGVVRAVSGTCSHQGCRLLLDTTARRLDCPCHTTVFALSGEVVTHQLPVAPGPLPLIAARELDGAIQVLSAEGSG
jgi:nitrite reductase/ring-hydroxylating ferredoxin subunit